MTSPHQHRWSSPAIANATWWVLLNIPFVAGHPDGFLCDWLLLRSLMINLVLFWAPGWACLAPRSTANHSRTWLPLGVILISFAAFIGVLGAFQLLGWNITASGIWNATWLLTNLLFACRLALFHKPTGLLPSHNRELMVAITLFAVTYPMYFLAATRVVPPQLDHDFEIQGTGGALLNRMEPLLLTDRGTYYYFAHPPLLHFYVAASFLEFDQARHLAIYDAASQRVRAATRGDEFVPLQGQFAEFPIIGRRQNDYLLSRPDGTIASIPVERVELELIEDYYLQHPHRLETRTPTIFLAAATVAMLGWWSTCLSGSILWGGLVGLAYATSPEVFVRSSYGGYFGISNFAIVMLMWTSSAWNNHSRPQNRLACLLAGFFAAIANHKLVLFPIAIAAFAFVRQLADRSQRLRWTTAVHPSLLGFAIGTATFWLYGLSIDPRAFWTEHVRTHLIDRVAHINPLGYTGYPSIQGLWQEFFAHTGYALGLLSLVALLAMTFRATPDPEDATQSDDATQHVSTRTLRSWLTWIMLTAVVFTLVDWRMTKHLMVLMPPLFLIPVIWSQQNRVRQWVAGSILVATLCWNLVIVQRLVVDFGSLSISPGW